MKPDDLPTNVLYSVSTTRWRDGRDPSMMEKRLANVWFVERIYRHMGGKRPNWVHPTGYVYEPEDIKILERAKEFMREFCSMDDTELELLLINKSLTDAAKFSVKVKGERFTPEAEKVFLEGCKGKKRMLNALLMYCGKWGIMPDNMTEITMLAAFEGGRRGDLGKEFMKKMADRKRWCRDLLDQIMRMNGISESEPISTIMERLA